MWAIAIVGVQYALGLGTVVLVLFMFGVRPDNFARWLVSPVGLFLLAVTAAVVVWSYRRRDR